MIETDKLTKIYQDRDRGEVVGARELTFCCRPGEVFGLLGPNGAGKTTTLRMLATIIRPTAGTARVNGHEIQERPADVRGSIGYLPSGAGLYPKLTAREMIWYFGRLNGVGKGAINDRVEEVIEYLDIASYAGVRCEKLSSGMRQKVSIARTIVHDPPVLIFDEPTTGLDVIVARRMLDYIDQCRDQGKCVIFSTHILREAERLCDILAILNEGCLLAIGSLEDLRRRTEEHYLEDIFISLVGRGN